MHTTVIYHRADFDGIFCREIARKFTPDAELIGWDYADEPIPFPSEGKVYILDLSPQCFISFPEHIEQIKDRVVWIDHHKSAIDRWSPAIPGYRIDGVAACRLAYHWFVCQPVWKTSDVLASKQDFIDRRVAEPMGVRLAGEYDVWDKRDPRAELFQHGLRSRDLDSDCWRRLLSGAHLSDDTALGGIVGELLNAGRSIQYVQTKQNESIINELGFTFQWEGLTWLACNHARYNSLLFTAGLKPEHDGCFGFKFTGKQWSVSLYGVPGKPDLDLSQIATKYGGGGHKQACGFRTNQLPFPV